MKVSFFEKHFDANLDLNLENFSEVSTDTRTLKKGALFIALSGENFDGNRFVEEAFKKGAAAALVSDKSLSGNVVVVENVLSALQSLAKAWQKHVSPAVVGITGSNGKTTSKFFTAQILSELVKVCFSPKSFNNEIGVPITQVMLEEGDEVLVSEIGTNAKGEIKTLTEMVEPEIAVVTTVGPSHLEGFGTVENVAKEKAEIYKSAKLKTAIFNLDNEWTAQMYKEHEGEKISFSTQKESADLFLKPEALSLGELSLKGHVCEAAVNVSVPVFGVHNAYNILTALSVGHALGLKVESLLSKLNKLQTPWGRSQVLNRKGGGKVLFDGYNSNLQSMKALIDAVKLQMDKGEEVRFVLGEMLELGEASDSMHRELGEMVGVLNPKSIHFIGPSNKHFKEGVSASKFSNSLVISDTYDESLAIELQNMLDPKDRIVIKGSRGMKLERFFKALGVFEES